MRISQKSKSKIFHTVPNKMKQTFSSKQEINQGFIPHVGCKNYNFLQYRKKKKKKKKKPELILLKPNGGNPFSQPSN
jgi:hypothetical protein